MSSHVIVNLLRPFTERIWFHFKMEPPAETELFYCKTISQWQILFYAKRTILFPHGTYHHVIWLSSRFTGKLWTSPEILRENFPPARGTQRGDVFSFSIVCFEIMMRSEPYSFDHMTARGLLSLLPFIHAIFRIRLNKGGATGPRGGSSPTIGEACSQWGNSGNYVGI